MLHQICQLYTLNAYINSSVATSSDDDQNKGVADTTGDADTSVDEKKPKCPCTWYHSWTIILLSQKHPQKMKSQKMITYVGDVIRCTLRREIVDD